VRAVRFTLPEPLGLLLSDEPVLDLYAAGPWRVPDSLAAQVRERALEVSGTAEALALRPRHKPPSWLTADAAVVVTDLIWMVSWLCGLGAVRGGSYTGAELELFRSFNTDLPPYDPDPLQWQAAATTFRPFTALVLDDPEHQAEGMAVLARCLDVLAGIAPLEPRRQAALAILTRLAGADGPALAVAWEEAEEAWAAAATREELAVLPELAGPEGHLAWAWDGLAAAHRRLGAAVPGSTALAQAAAEIVLQAGLAHPPGALAAATGTSQYREIQDRVTAATARDFRPRAWHDQVRAWLARALAAGEIDACRAWLDMATRITAIIQGLPGMPVSPAPSYLPVGAFQRDVRAFARPRRPANPLAAALTPAPDPTTTASPAPAGGEPGGEGPGQAARQAARDPAAELDGLPGLAEVKEQVDVLLAVARAEAARRDTGITLRPAWKNLAFAGPPGTGKSRVAAILARAYRDLRVLTRSHLTEVTRADLSGPRPADTTGPSASPSQQSAARSQRSARYWKRRSQGPCPRPTSLTRKPSSSSTEPCCRAGPGPPLRPCTQESTRPPE
jgi:hypothetical protein